MIQASERWVSDRRGQYKTVTFVTEYVSPEIGEIVLYGKTGELFSLLLGQTDLRQLADACEALLTTMETHP